MKYLKKNNNNEDVLKTAKQLDIGKSIICNPMQSSQTKKKLDENSYSFI